MRWMITMEIKVYGTEFCPNCQRIKDFLKENEIKFKYIDVGKDKEAAKKMIETTGQRGVPVIEINGEIIVDFKEEEIKEKLGV